MMKNNRAYLARASFYRLKRLVRKITTLKTAPSFLADKKPGRAFKEAYFPRASFCFIKKRAEQIRPLIFGARLFKKLQAGPRK